MATKKKTTAKKTKNENIVQVKGSVYYKYDKTIPTAFGLKESGKENPNDVIREALKKTESPPDTIMYLSKAGRFDIIFCLATMALSRHATERMLDALSGKCETCDEKEDCSLYKDGVTSPEAGLVGDIKELLKKRGINASIETVKVPRNPKMFTMKDIKESDAH